MSGHRHPLVPPLSPFGRGVTFEELEDLPDEGSGVGCGPSLAELARVAKRPVTMGRRGR